MLWCFAFSVQPAVLRVLQYLIVCLLPRDKAPDLPVDTTNLLVFLEQFVCYGEHSHQVNVFDITSAQFFTVVSSFLMQKAIVLFLFKIFFFS